MVVSTDTAEEERMDEAVNGFFVLPIFVLLGLALPWGAWVDLGRKGPALAGLILLFRRLPWVLALTGLVPRNAGRTGRVVHGVVRSHRRGGALLRHPRGAHGWP